MPQNSSDSAEIAHSFLKNGLPEAVWDALYARSAELADACFRWTGKETQRVEEVNGLLRTLIALAPDPERRMAVQLRCAWVLAVRGRHEEAIAQCDALYIDKTANAEPLDGIHLYALSCKALSLLAVARAAEAMVVLSAALPCHGAHVAAEPALAFCMLARARVQLALAEPVKALDALRVLGEDVTLQAMHHDVWLTQALAFLSIHRPMQAVAALQPVFAEMPDHPAALVLYGQALCGLDEFAYAVDRFERAIHLAPAYAPAYRYMASALAMLNLDDDALKCLRKALTLRPDWPDAWLDEAGIRLRRGELLRGFEAYEWRDGARQAGRHPQYWNGEQPLNGASLLVVAEQGYGDTLQFVRYLPQLVALGAQVTMEVQPALLRLIAQQAEVWGVDVIARGTPRPACRFETLLMSLPYALRTRLDTIPASIPYLSVLPGQHAEVPVRHVDKKGCASRTLRVGIVPNGNPQHANDAVRSMPLATLAPLLSTPGITFCLLQPAPGKGDLAWAATHPERITPLPLAGDFADTAALVSTLDLIISVDTALAHLCGALAKPVWIMLPVLSDWRWMRDRHDSPWYPNARLFRQQTHRDWAPVMAELQTALCTLRDTEAG